MRAPALVAIVVALAVVAGCGPRYVVWPNAQPSPAGWVAARRDSDGAVVAVRPAELQEQVMRDDGARWVGRRLTRPKRFAAGAALAVVGVALGAVGLGLGVDASGQRTPDGATNRGIAVGFGSVGAAALVTGVALLWWAWPPRPTDEPIAAHPELVDAPPPLP